jgi:hypothetical protein
MPRPKRHPVTAVSQEAGRTARDRTKLVPADARHQPRLLCRLNRECGTRGEDIRATSGLDTLMLLH